MKIRKSKLFSHLSHLCNRKKFFFGSISSQRDCPCFEISRLCQKKERKFREENSAAYDTKKAILESLFVPAANVIFLSNHAVQMERNEKKMIYITPLKCASRYAHAHHSYKKLLTDIDPQYLCFYCYCWPTLQHIHESIEKAYSFHSKLFHPDECWWGKFSTLAVPPNTDRMRRHDFLTTKKSFSCSYAPSPTRSRKVWENFSFSTSNNFHIQHISKGIVSVIDFSRRTEKDEKNAVLMNPEGLDV